MFIESLKLFGCACVCIINSWNFVHEISSVFIFGTEWFCVNKLFIEDILIEFDAIR